MNRSKQKIVALLMAFLVFAAPLSGLAMQAVDTAGPADHCQQPAADTQPAPDRNPQHFQCTMESCAESCGTTRHCSSQSPVILSLHDAQACPAGSGFAINSATGNCPRIQFSGPYRPPRA